MTKGKQHKSKMYEKWYGQPYVPKTLVEIKRCVKCGREMPENSEARNCCYCGGTFQTKYVLKQKPSHNAPATVASCDASLRVRCSVLHGEGLFSLSGVVERGFFSYRHSFLFPSVHQGDSTLQGAKSHSPPRSLKLF